MKRPRATLTDVKHGTTKQYGTPATKVIIEQHTDLTADFVEDYCHTIWFEEILDHLTSYNDEPKGKFDIIAAFGMMELADQELSGRQPVKIQQDEASFEDFGYWKDEKGIKHYGIKNKKQTIKYELKVDEDDTYRFETSDTRLYQAVIQNGVYR